jgi:hypothetical protein
MSLLKGKNIGEQSTGDSGLELSITAYLLSKLQNRYNKAVHPAAITPHNGKRDWSLCPAAGSEAYRLRECK